MIVSYFGQTVRCALNKDIHDILNKESVLERVVVYKFDEKSTVSV